MSFLTVLPLAFVMIAGPSGQGTVKTVIDWLVLVLFLFLMVRTYLRRKDTRTPKWMGRLQTADVVFFLALSISGLFS